MQPGVPVVPGLVDAGAVALMHEPTSLPAVFVHVSPFAQLLLLVQPVAQVPPKEVTSAQ